MVSVFPRLSVVPAFLIMVIGVVSVIDSAGPMGAWIGIEVNLLGAVCFFVGVSVEEAESALNYFIIQVVGSGFLVMGSVIVVGCTFLVKYSGVLIVLGLMVNLGVFPFHFWVPSVMVCLSWTSCFMLSVVQKIGPLWLLSNLCSSGYVISWLEVCSCLTGLVGCVGGLGVLHFRLIVAYSSLVHLGIMVLLSLVSVESVFVYLTLYGLISLGLMWGFFKLGMYSYLDVTKVSGAWWTRRVVVVCFYLLSLAGLPPFIGSGLNVLFLLECWGVFPIGCAFLTLCSGVSLVFYLSCFIYISLNTGTAIHMIMGLEKGLDIFELVSIIFNLILGFPLFFFLIEWL